MAKERMLELIKKYDITPYGDRIKVSLKREGDPGELDEIKSMKQEILQYFNDLQKKKAEKERQEKEQLVEKARAGKEGLRFIIDYDDFCPVHVGIARRMYPEEKAGYSKWYAESAFILMCSTELPQIRFEDTPKHKPDGTVSGGSDRVWVITYNEYIGYINKNNDREKQLEIQRAAEERRNAELISQYETEKKTILAKVDDWSVKVSEIHDEGGKTKEYTHSFQINGESLSYTERNIFDVGVVINPCYSVHPDMEPGGIAIKKDGILQWHVWDQSGWHPVRPLTKEEVICYTIITKFGKFSKSGIRM